jgi:hypothetical protein
VILLRPSSTAEVMETLAICRHRQAVPPQSAMTGLAAKSRETVVTIEFETTRRARVVGPSAKCVTPSRNRHRSERKHQPFEGFK